MLRKPLRRRPRLKERAAKREIEFPVAILVGVPRPLFALSGATALGGVFAGLGRPAGYLLNGWFAKRLCGGRVIG